MMNTTVIAIINQKGGVGKSTTAQAFASGLKRKGYSVLSIDLDAQANLSYTADVETEDATAFDVLTGEARIDEAIQATDNGDFIAASKALAILDKKLKDAGKQYRLKEALEGLKGRYQYIILDTPPALGIITLNALTACDEVIIPAQADVYSLKGIQELQQSIQTVRKDFNPDLKIAGILFTRHNPRTSLSKEITDIVKQYAEHIGTKLFESTIREAVAVKEAQLNKESLFEYAPRAKVTADYSAFIEEYLNEVQEHDKEEI